METKSIIGIWEEMMTEYDKKYWKRVYLYFGNDFEAWCIDYESNFAKEYRNKPIWSIYDYPEYFDTGALKFTDKFLEEVMTW